MFCTTLKEKVLWNSYLVAFRIVSSKKPDTIAEELILPSAIDMCEVDPGMKYIKNGKPLQSVIIQIGMGQFVGVCTDHDDVMTGSKSGLVARVKLAAHHKCINQLRDSSRGLRLK
ncbi:hypothetical protein RF11_12216 [Thelohanellus kitauei]|uniref:Uncharacterized protein n=1 Tax=Thelohanellus kitauei TaxID=669202 RepID=A0A0C2NBG8_THEKT|nr:hypothetical protein RF11_12216 [Thelohanellus kitauei]